MLKYVVLIPVLVLVAVTVSLGQQFYHLPDLRSMKRLSASKQVDRAPDIPGNETNMDYYAGADGMIVTVYSYRGNKAAFSIHNNSDIQKTYRLFIDNMGNGLFQEISPTIKWTLPDWAKRFR